jgi:hypothetical protein
MDKEKIIWIGAGVVAIIGVSFSIFNSYSKIESVQNSDFQEEVSVEEEKETEISEEEVEEEPEDLVTEEELSVINKISEIEGYIDVSEEMLDEVDRLKSNPMIVSDIEENLERVKEDFVALDTLYPEADITDSDFQNEVERIYLEAENIFKRVENLF